MMSGPPARKHESTGRPGLSAVSLQRFADGAAHLRTQAGEFLFRQQSVSMNLGLHQRAPASQIIEDARHLSIALLDDLEAIKVALMSAVTTMHHSLNLDECSLAEAFNRERVQTHQDLPVAFRYGALHGADSIIVEAQREGHGRARFPHFPCGEPGNPVADVVLGHGLEIVKVCSARIRHSVVFCQDDLCGDTADS